MRSKTLVLFLFKTLSVATFLRWSQCCGKFKHSVILCHPFVFSRRVVPALWFFRMSAYMYAVTQHIITIVTVFYAVLCLQRIFNCDLCVGLVNRNTTVLQHTFIYGQQLYSVSLTPSRLMERSLHQQVVVVVKGQYLYRNVVI